MNREKALNFCNRVIEISLYALAFYIPIATGLIESFAGLAIFAWIIKKIIARRLSRELLPQSVLKIPILLYFIACFISALFSSNRQISFTHLALKNLEYMLIFFVVTDTLDKRILRNILIVFVFSVCLLSIDGIYQYFTHHDFLRGRRQIIEGRISASFTTPNDFSNYMVTLLPIVASLALLNFRKRWLRIIVAAVALMAFACILVSTVRSAWVALLLAIPLFMFTRNRRMTIWALVVIVVVLAMVHILPPMARLQIINFFDIKSWDSMHRQILWAMGFRMFLSSPITGLGLGTFMYNFTSFMPKDYPVGDWGISYTHNCFIQMLAETGLLGLIAFLLIIGVLFTYSFRVIKKIKQQQEFYILCGLIVSLFTYLVSSFFDTNFYSLPLTMLFWLILGITAKSGAIFSGQKTAAAGRI